MFVSADTSDHPEITRSRVGLTGLEEPRLLYQLHCPVCPRVSKQTTHMNHSQWDPLVFQVKAQQPAHHQWDPLVLTNLPIMFPAALLP